MVCSREGNGCSAMKNALHPNPLSKTNLRATMMQSYVPMGSFGMSDVDVE